MSMVARSLLSPFDLHLFNEGTHSHLFEKLGAHPSHDPEGTYSTRPQRVPPGI